MSTVDYDECEKLFCGSWTVAKEENVEKFLAASGMSDEMKTFIRQENAFTIARVGNIMVEKATVGGLDLEMNLPINEEIEWKEKEDNPIFHVKTLATFKDGIWSQATTPLNKDGGKTQTMKSYIQGDELIAEFSLPDVPGVTAKRTFKRV